METTEIRFHEITLADKAWMSEMYARDNKVACEYTFANNFIWRKYYRGEAAEVCGCLVIRYRKGEDYWYSYPVGGGDKRTAVERLMLECRENGRTLFLAPFDEADRRDLYTWFPGHFFIEPDRDDYDYVYDREKLATLAGKKLHGKRNHIARFKDGGEWSYEPMTAENLEECRTMTYRWIRMREEKWNGEMEEEILVLHEAFDHMEELGLVGGVLRREGEIVAFTMGEPMNDEMFVVHFEKAFPDMQGAYPMINQQFVLHACEGYQYINREEDTGDPGLRKAKLSYYPEILLKKYYAMESEVVCADSVQDGEQILKIWQTCFGDEETYIRFYLEHRMTEDNMLVIYQDGRAVSMASFLPAQYLCNGEYLDARYVYAVATLPEYRGRGYAGRILAFAQKKYGVPLLLAPAEESLVSYYEKRGFCRVFSDSRRSFGGSMAAQELPETTEASFAVEPVTAQEYVRIRDRKYEREGYVRWNEEAVQYAMDVNACCGGETVALVYGDVTGRQEQAGRAEKDILMYRREGNVLVIQETTIDSDRLPDVLRYLLLETGANEACYGQMAGMLWLPAAMTQNKVPADGYLALTLE